MNATLPAALSTAVALVLAVNPALAQESSEAQLQYELGAEMYRQGRYAEAVERFLASNRLVPNANVVFNIAQTYDLMHRPADAYNWYESYAAFEGLDDEAIGRARAAQEELLSQIAVVNVVTDPAGALLFVDRPDLGSVGVAPRRVAVTPGGHHIIARREGYRESSSAVEAQTGRVEEVSFALEQILGSLTVESSPPGATVRIAGAVEPLGQTPLTAELPVGETRLVLSLARHVDQTSDVTIRDGEPAAISVELQRAASTVSVLTITSEPTGASVLIDGEPSGETPLSVVQEPGSRQITVTADGRQPWTSEVVLEAGAATRAEVALRSGSPRLWRSLRWVGWGLGAAVLAGGAVAGGLALSHRADFYEADNPTREQLDSVRTEALAADVLFGVGGAVLAATLVLELVFGLGPRSQGTLTIDR